MQPLFIFDFDGVIADLNIKTPEPEIISFIANQLNQSNAVVIATGRPGSFVLRAVASEIAKYLKRKDNLDNLYISSEKGAVDVTFKNAVAQETIDYTLSVPKQIMQKAKMRASSLMGINYDNEKYTMASVEAEAGSDSQKVEKEKKLLKEYRQWAMDEIISKNKDLVLETTPVAVDIQNKNVSKRTAVQKILSFLEKKGIPFPSEFIMFGDNPWDGHICEALAELGKKTRFFYVGMKPLKGKYNFPVIRSEKNYYEKATLELLKEYFQPFIK